MNFLKKMVNAALSPVGLCVCRRETLLKSNRYEVLKQRAINFLSEFESTATKSMFPGLPATPGRGELLLEENNFTLQAYHLLASLHQTLHLPGDVCEFGVAHGANSALMANELRNTDKHLWLYDSFQGLPKPTAKDILIDDIAKLGSMEKYQGIMSHSPAEVTARLEAIRFPKERAHIVPGFIEKTSTLNHFPERVCFAYVDFDFYEPIQIALALLEGRLVPGGIVVVDDYNFFSEGAKTATDEFVAQMKGRFTLSLPLGDRAGFAVLQKSHAALRMATAR